MNRFEGKVALVTGGSEGIGLAIAERLAREGARVAICGRREEALQQAAAAIGAAAEYQVLDVSDTEALAAWVEDVANRHGRLDALVNNAMHVGWGAISDTDVGAFREDFRVNVDAPFASTRAAMGIMAAQGGGAILNVTSINALLAIDNMAAYSSSKAALVHFTRCAAMEGARSNGRVNVIAPGVIATPSTNNALGGVPGYTEAVAGGVPMQRLGEPGEVAAAAAFLLSDEASYITAVCLSVDGGKSHQLVVPPPPGG